MERTQFHSPSPLPSIFGRLPPVTTPGQPITGQHRESLRAGLLTIPLAGVVGWALGSRRTGLAAGGLAALALGALRWQMSRWFCESPAYTVDGRIGDIELRTYPSIVEARAELESHSLEEALNLGFSRLACYVFGANTTDEDITMTTPVLTSLQDGMYMMSIAMPPGRTLPSLPEPDDPRVVLREVPVRRFAVLRFAGRFSHENVSQHERRLLREVVDLGLVTRGSARFAMYDSPATLPVLRRNEVWLEIV
ncbi:MAG TPA: heme-binding protein [Kofleriaceae bacterium]|nr:heme-binding protein [Kofleriaceae bacterium]